MPKQSLIDTAKAPILAYNKKHWEAVRAAIAPRFVYDEVATHRKTQGADKLLEAWQAWARALPDSKATFRNALVSGNNVVLEITWRGTHTGPLQMPGGEVAPTGNKFELRACLVIEVAAGKARGMRQYFDMATLMQQLAEGK
jgi:steroid delta-isomerase-like uncharacterized protein